MADRQKELSRHLERDPGDPFLRYAMAMEHKKAGRLDEALDWFGKTLEADETYCYAHYQIGQVHEQREDNDAASAAYEKGIAAAKKHNDAHAAGEMQVALDLLD
ncbi:MAG: tetratricopeptide repeat protein [Planctomycetota bacterium]